MNDGGQRTLDCHFGYMRGFTVTSLEAFEGVCPRLSVASAYGITNSKVRFKLETTQHCALKAEQPA